MTCAVCPNCGLDLSPFETISRGDLSIPDQVTIRWRGRDLKLTRQQRLIVLALVRADGQIVSRHALMEACGTESDYALDPSNVVDVQLSRIRNAFKSVEPMFDQIETVWGAGLRWRAEANA